MYNKLVNLNVSLRIFNTNQLKKTDSPQNDVKLCSIDDFFDKKKTINKINEGLLKNSLFSRITFLD